jgi:flagellin
MPFPTTVINTNIYALNAQRNLQSVEVRLAEAMQRLSSGLRINSAKDDASGLAIAARMTTQVRGMAVAIRNLSDGVSVAQTAEGGLDSITNNLQRIRELAVQAANGTLSTSDRAALQAEVVQLRDEITRVGNQTTFNGMDLLDGTWQPAVFQAGANVGDTLTFNAIGDSRATAIGATINTGQVIISGGGPGGVPGFTANNVAITTSGVATAQSVNVRGTVYNLGTFEPSAKALATAINALGVPGLTASADANVWAGQSSTSYANFFDPEGVLKLNGVDITLHGSKTNTIAQNRAIAVAAINAKSAQTGVSAADNGQGVVLTAADGRNITALFTPTDINFADYDHDGLDDDPAPDYATVAQNFGLRTTGSTGVAATIDIRYAAPAGVKSGSVEFTPTTGLASRHFNVIYTETPVTTFTPVSSVDVSTVAGANLAMQVVDGALATVNARRAGLGATMNRLESAISNLRISYENQSAAKSRIEDADFAQETAKLARSQTLQSASLAILSQANAIPGNVLSLLRLGY